MENVILVMIIFIILSVTAFAADNEKIIIAHRGASGYLPEHTLHSKAMAYAMGADYLEQDLVMTKDDRLVVLHDRFLDRVTNVADIFPDRKRKDGRYYVLDFTLDELKQLNIIEGFKIENGERVANFPERFPLGKSEFKINTFEDEIEMIQGLNKSTGKNVGIYPEIKSPWFHRHEGKDISKETLRILKKYGYTTKKSKIYLQCFDPVEIKRIRKKLMPEMAMDLKLIQLIAETSWNETMTYGEDGKEYPYDYDWMFKRNAMKKIAEYADGVGPWKSMIIKDESKKENIIETELVKDAYKAGMEVHPYTFRLDEGMVPEYAENFEDMLDIFLYKIGVDGVFTDFPDRAVDFVKNHK